MFLNLILDSFYNPTREDDDLVKTKFFLAQFLVEVDVTDRPDFDDLQATDYFSSAFWLSGNDKKHEVKVYALAAKPDSRQDVAIEEYEYRGFPITVYQNAHTVGADVPTYFATVTNLQTKSKNASVVAGDSEIVKVVKDAAQNHVDKLVSRRKH